VLFALSSVSIPVHNFFADTRITFQHSARQVEGSLNATNEVYPFSSVSIQYYTGGRVTDGQTDTGPCGQNQPDSPEEAMLVDFAEQTQSFVGSL